MSGRALVFVCFAAWPVLSFANKCTVFEGTAYTTKLQIQSAKNENVAELKSLVEEFQKLGDLNDEKLTRLLDERYERAQTPVKNEEDLAALAGPWALVDALGSQRLGSAKHPRSTDDHYRVGNFAYTINSREGSGFLQFNVQHKITEQEATSGVGPRPAATHNKMARVYINIDSSKVAASLPELLEKAHAGGASVAKVFFGTEENVTRPDKIVIGFLKGSDALRFAQSAAPALSNNYGVPQPKAPFTLRIGGAESPVSLAQDINTRYEYESWGGRIRKVLKQALGACSGDRSYDCVFKEIKKQGVDPTWMLPQNQIQKILGGLK